MITAIKGWLFGLSRTAPGAGSGLLVTVIALCFSVLFGFSVALFDGALGLALAGLIIGLALVTSPRTTVWVVVVGSLSIAGLVELYLPGFQSIRWAFAILSITLAVVSTLKYFSSSSSDKSSPTADVTALAATMLMFFLCVVLSTITGNTSLSNAISGFKNYFQLWGLILALAWLGYSSTEAKRFIVFLAALSFVQLPFVLHQFLVLVPLRSGVLDAARNIVAVDIVAGTFGGNMNGGGRSADLALLASFTVTLVFAQWKTGNRRLGMALLLAALSFAPMLLNEAKLALVLLPLGLLMLFRDSIVKRPFSWMLGAGAMAVCMAAIVGIYSLLPGAESQRSKSIGEFVTSAIEYNVGNKGYGSAVLNRTTVYQYWWREHVNKGNVLATLFGHGPGFSNTNSIARGDNIAASRYAGFAIGLTGLSAMLWDTGLMGASAFLLMMLMAFRLGQRMTQKWRGTGHEPFIQAVQIGVVLIAVSLLHNDYVTFDIGFQTMLAVFVGYLLAMAKAPLERTRCRK